MTIAFAINAACTAVNVVAILFFLRSGNRRPHRHQAVQELYIVSSTHRAHRDLATRG